MSPLSIAAYICGHPAWKSSSPATSSCIKKKKKKKREFANANPRAPGPRPHHLPFRSHDPHQIHRPQSCCLGATSFPPALLTYSLPFLSIHSCPRNPPQKQELQNDHPIQLHAQFIPAQPAAPQLRPNSARFPHPPLLLVRPPRALGEPLHLPRPSRRRPVTLVGFVVATLGRALSHQRYRSPPRHPRKPL